MTDTRTVGTHWHRQTLRARGRRRRQHILRWSSWFAALLAVVLIALGTNDSAATLGTLALILSMTIVSPRSTRR